MAFLLFLLLAVQLTGLTCIQDAWANSIPGYDSISAMALTNTSFSNPPSGSSVPSQQTIHHDCPCHHLVTHFSGFALDSTPYKGELAFSISTFVPDNLPKATFHPPLSLL
jgi:hypothetical protein